jgi:fluoride ion exporter CrcB/FEX
MYKRAVSELLLASRLCPRAAAAACRCVLRWYLSRYNYKLRGSWDWFPAGTYAANMLGVAIDFSLQVRRFCGV